ncbi:MAG: mobile mystery protein A [Bacteroidales bacterium]
MKKQKLILEQVDRRIKEVIILDSVVIPSEGWIYSIRNALGMSLRQLGKRLKITAQSVKEIEIREKSGTVSLAVLRQLGACLDMKLVYCFIPKTGSLEQMIENRAREIATEIVRRTSASMILEDQGNTETRLRKSILEKTIEIKQEMPKYLWD